MDILTYNLWVFFLQRIGWILLHQICSPHCFTLPVLLFPWTSGWVLGLGGSAGDWAVGRAWSWFIWDLSCLEEELSLGEVCLSQKLQVLSGTSPDSYPLLPPSSCSALFIPCWFSCPAHTFAVSYLTLLKLPNLSVQSFPTRAFTDTQKN